MRTEYRNGDPITLPGGCDSCQPLRINSILCHEIGCPDAWRDHKVACFECGCDFYPEEGRQQTCPDCLNPPDFDDEDFEDDEDATVMPLGGLDDA